MRRMTTITLLSLALGTPQLVWGQGVGAGAAQRAAGQVQGRPQVPAPQQLRPQHGGAQIDARSRATLEVPGAAARGSQSTEAGAQFSNNPVFRGRVEERSSIGLGRRGALGLQVRQEAEARGRLSGQFGRPAFGRRPESRESHADEHRQRQPSSGVEFEGEVQGRARVAAGRRPEHAASRAEFFLQNRLAEIDRMRDRAIELDNPHLLRKADDLERLARWQFEMRTQHEGRARGEFASDPSKPQLQFRNLQQVGAEADSTGGVNVEQQTGTDLGAGHAGFELEAGAQTGTEATLGPGTTEPGTADSGSVEQE